MPNEQASPKGCQGCRGGNASPITMSMAFQPILRLPLQGGQGLFAYEALVRGTDGSGAASVLAQVGDDNRYGFDQSCRTTAIELATRLGLPATGALLSINFLPNAVYEPRACIRATLDAAQRHGFPVRNLMFEVTEGEHLHNPKHLLNILHSYHEMGFHTAIDDFGAGYSGLNLLAQFQPDVVKIDMALVRDAESNPAQVTILRHTAALCRELGIAVVAEGVETLAEYQTLHRLGIELFQGYFFAKPGFEQLPEPAWPA